MVSDTDKLLSQAASRQIISYAASSPKEKVDESKVNEKELDEVYEIIGLGRAQYLYWMVVVLVSYSYYSELALLSVLLPILKCEWSLSYNFAGLTTAAVFGSCAVMSICFSRLADIYGRKVVLVWSTFFLILGAIGGPVSPNKWVFLACRLVAGGAIGIQRGSLTCYAVEFAESKYRATGIAINTSSTYVGILVVHVVGWLSLDYVGWRWFTVIVTVPAFLALVMLIILPESPRFLCVSGQQARALHSLTFMARLNGVNLPSNLHIICHEAHDLGSVSKIFSKDHQRSTISLAIIYTMNIIIDYGLVVFLPLLFSSDLGTTNIDSEQDGECVSLSPNDLLKLAVTSIVSIFGAVAAKVFCNAFGSFIPLRISSFIQVATLGLLFIKYNSSYTFCMAVLARLSEAFINTVAWIIIPESFPTSIRSTAIGFIAGCGRVGGLFGTVAVYPLSSINPFFVVALFLVAASVGLSGAFVLNKKKSEEGIADE